MSCYLFEKVVPEYNPKGATILYYGFSSSQESQQTVPALLSSLICQLIDADRKLLLEILHMWEERQKVGLEFWDERALFKVLRLVFDTPRQFSIMCIVGALDEC